MVRKVKAYLEGHQVIDNEMELDRLSYDIEPHVQSRGDFHWVLFKQFSSPEFLAANRGAIRRPPSPTLSTHSSQSAGSSEQRKFPGAKFGVESPQAMQKMLTLVQNTTRLKGTVFPRTILSKSKFFRLFSFCLSRFCISQPQKCAPS